MSKKPWQGYWPFLILFCFSLLLMTAQLTHQATIVGSDAIFHYNRFYDTAMQLKTGQLNYFISLFGYQQSGRIVNALYGPLFAYVQGGLLLISGSWFRYQLLSRLLLSLLAGTGLYTLLRRLAVSAKLAMVLSLLFLTTFSIQYWSFRQGFSSWGVAFFPFCLLPAIITAQSKEVKWFPLGLTVALMLQVHTLSTLFLLISYLPFFTYAFLASKEKWRFLRQVGTSVIFCLILTANVWLPLLSLSQANELIKPFTNQRLPLFTIDRLSQNLLSQPKGLSWLIWLALGLGLLTLKTNKPVYQLSLASLLIFLFLSSSLFPWDSLAGQGIEWVELIQFPFRFFLIATIWLLLALGQGLSQFKRGQLLGLGGLVALTLAGAYQVITTEQALIASQYQTDTPIQLRKHTHLLGTAEQVRQSLHSPDLSAFLKLAVKATPDYLPIYQDTTENTYKLYDRLVITPNQSMTKTAIDGQLEVTWVADDQTPIQLPIIIYADSYLLLNGKPLQLTPKALSPIGTPLIVPQLGRNHLILSYRPKPYLDPAIWLSLLGWGTSLGYGAHYWLKTRRKIADSA